MITPYAPALTAKVVDYLADAGIEVVDAISLERHRQPRRRPARPGRGWSG